ncbi:syn-copalyl diphosphate synthase, chloroplastic isoform 1 [Oryza sativa Japonica Group]|uniref:Syn-copalyl diphosphate synthase, chloroplastic n=3 Tax=Oryza sativa subsp. japonica TaxID=39947 RepID=CPS4_ORYSJ|nr:syn-copalyl diphosphate synthase, chloroplastic isoform 1 [Oryza sativa Japonica Group]Q0JF02.1 RecName: Full=Syn-copalyl diphosphate synthase, chloroplastic; Short=OsCPSsyn; Short=Syn-CPP synthase; AltName: Full=OsCPS4; AltName: Full=OsCyc1; Flags: Precursor [Oryza sativa Japonica Group]KAF2932837.1 hypothetical protein DAI22_04g030200 [Oryza sativa Japonica Group]BAF14085.1 Os04g0178300 [Oryza sativa Japonica Group]|eukprot:NP_001052171.1 Os04g0178300 [Oryza sativa Japonica Group]
MPVFTASFQCVTLFGQPASAADAQPLLQGQRPFLHLHARRRRPCGPMLISKSPPYPASEETREWEADGQHEHTDELRETTTTMIDGIRTALRSIGEGEISISAYDTSLVALLKRLDGGDGPQFPSTIDWIVQNQLPDGSWGDASFFMMGDRIMSTLACVVALKSWNIHTDKCERGLLFIQENMWRLAHEEEDWMLVGFEIALPSLLDMAKDLDLDIPYDEPALKAIYAERERKLAKIPRDVLHSMPTTLLHSLEGMVDLDWEKLLKLRCLDGSFHCSPASTATAFQQTGDQKCFEYLDGIVKKFNGGVPCIYPLDVYERLWAVDRLTRLGISRHFTSEIEDCLDYIFRNWTPDGLAHTKNCPVKDIDDTAMGFRLLRLYGYQVDPCVLKKFEKDGKFFCLHGESNPSSVTPMYNTYRASQLKFPGDDGVLGRAEVFCRSFLQDRRGSNRMKDKWAIAKDIPGEVEYAMDYPWKASLPRIETRLYLDQYGGSGDVWIGKVLHRMTLFCNDLYLKAAKADFSNFQKECRVELNGLRRWYLRSNLEKFGGTDPQTTLMTSYFLASANIFEANRAAERLGWARVALLADAVSSHFRRIGGPKNSTSNLEELISLVPFDDAYSGSLREAWKQWLMAWTAKESSQESIEGDTAILLVRAIEIFGGRHVLTGQRPDLWEYSQLEQLTSSICCKLSRRVLAQENGESTEKVEEIDQQVDLEMQELTRRVLQGCSAINRLTRETFLHVVKSFCYVAYCSPETIDSHIDKVIFQDVI